MRVEVVALDALQQERYKVMIWLMGMYEENVQLQVRVWSRNNSGYGTIL